MRWSSFMRELHMSVTVAHAHACNRIDDDAYALAAAEFIFPVHGLVAIHAVQHFFPVRPAQRLLPFGGTPPPFLYLPFTNPPCTDPPTVMLVMKQWAGAQPCGKYLRR